MTTILVGVDGSDSSRAALEWAIREARIRDAKVRALHAYTYPLTIGPLGQPVPPPDVDMRAEAQAFVENEVKEVVGGDSDVEVITDVAELAAAPALIRASRSADLLVVGSRGMGGFRGLLLGSVGQQCAQHALCPVVIVPHAERNVRTG